MLFNSQHGNVDITKLSLLCGAGAPGKRTQPAVTSKSWGTQPADTRSVSQPGHELVKSSDPAPKEEPASQPINAGTMDEADIFTKIDRLAELYNKGILTEAEFTAKKTELLQRI